MGGGGELTKAYLNYPNPHMTLHNDLACAEIAKMSKANQRDVAITRASFTQAIGQLTNDGFRLGADASINDFWLSVDFGDPEFEEALARYVCRLLGQRYTPLQRARINRRC